MDEVAELRHMLMGFRVSELQVLLGFAGRSKSGRKHELMGRALQLLKCEGNYQIRAKIKDLYRQRYPRKLASPPPRTVGHGRFSVVPQSVPVRGREVPNGIPIHPDVRLISLPFFEYIDDLVRPTSLVPRGMSQFQESYVVFHLTPRQVNLITTSRDTRPNSKNDYTVQVQIRFCLLETSCEQEDNFPSSLCIKVNGKICPLPISDLQPSRNLIVPLIDVVREALGKSPSSSSSSSSSSSPLINVEGNQNTLTMHLPSVARFAEVKRKCDVCGLLVPRRHVARHRRTHANQKRFQCAGCGAEFGEGYGLRNHRKTCPKTRLRDAGAQTDVTFSPTDEGSLCLATEPPIELIDTFVGIQPPVTSKQADDHFFPSVVSPALTTFETPSLCDLLDL